MNIEELRRQSIEQFASLRRKAMFEAQQNSPITVTSNAAAGASGGGSTVLNTNPKAIKISAKNNTIGYYEETTGNLVFFNADWDSVSFSDNADSKIPYADIDGWGFDRMIDGKGVLVRVTMNNNDRYYIFLDAGCNIIETVHLVSGSTYGTGANRRSAEGLVIQLSYRNDLGRIIKWWNGDEIFTHTDTTINSNGNNFNLDWYGYDDAFSDGTTSAYINDEDLGYNRIFHCRPDGQFLEVTSSFRINETLPQDSYLHCIGDFAISPFIFSTPNLSGTASYNTESFDVTLSAPIPGLRRGMNITGTDFLGTPLVTAISNDGLTITLSQYPSSTNNDSPVEFTGSFVDTLRVTLVDGTYTDFDISAYDANAYPEGTLFGSDKAMFCLHRYFDNTAIYVVYNHSTGQLNTTEPLDYFNNPQSYNINMKQNFLSVNSVAGCEKLLAAQLGGNSWDGKMYRYDDLTFIWSNSLGELFTYTFNTPDLATVGFNQANYGYGSPMYEVINAPESTDIEIIRFNDNGTVDITSLGTTYEDWTGYLQYGALGNKTYVSWKDNSRVLPDNKIQAFAVFAGNTVPADQIWVTENNNGSQFGKTQYIGQFDEGLTYMFNYALDEYYTISDAIESDTQFRYNTYQNSINFEQLSNAALYPGDGSFYLVNPSYTPPVKIEDGAGDAFRGNSDYAVKLSIDGGTEGFIRISVYDYEGTLVNSVLTQSTTYMNFDVVNERIFLSQNPTSNVWHFYIITPNEDGYVFKEILGNGISYFINSWGWVD